MNSRSGIARFQRKEGELCVTISFLGCSCAPPWESPLQRSKERCIDIGDSISLKIHGEKFSKKTFKQKIKKDFQKNQQANRDKEPSFAGK